MRHAILVLGGLASLAGCSNAERHQVGATQSSVSYRIAGNDISQANVSARQYCQRYGLGAQFQGLQTNPSGNVAVYTCAGPAAASGGSTVPPPPYAQPEVQCATPLHQDRPGRTDYTGPPVPGCATPRF